MKKADINLFIALDSSKTIRKHSVNSGIGIAIVLLFSVLLNAYIYQYFTRQVLQLKADNASILEFLQSPEATEKADKFNALISKAKLYNHYIITTEHMIQNIEDMPHFNESYFREFDALRPANVTYTDLSFQSNTLEIKCTTSNNVPPADFVKSLDESGIFKKVTYGGFTTSKDGEMEGYVFTILCETLEGNNEIN